MITINVLTFYFQDMLSLSNCIVNPSSAFVNGIIEPLIQLRKLKQLPSGYMILVLDSLCEAESHQPYAGDTISSFLSKHILKIPSWFKFIVTVRTNQLDRLSLLPFPKIRYITHIMKHLMFTCLKIYHPLK